MQLLIPKQKYKSVFDIPLKKLYEQRAKNMIIDLDNTLTEWNNPELSQNTISWIEKDQKIGFKLCFVSNNSAARVKEVADLIGIPFVARAGKPRRGCFRKAMELMQANSEATAVVGDQIFTDILGGNRLGLFTILVAPMSEKEFFGTKLTRAIERLILKYASEC